MTLKLPTVKNGKMNRYKTNFDFEYRLTGFSNNNLNNHLEHLFLWCCNPEDILITNQYYKKNYLKSIEEIRGIKLNIESYEDQQFQYWWADETDLEFTRTLNSNWVFHQWIIKNGFNKEEIIFHDKFYGPIKNNFLYKKEFGVSGKSFIYKLNNNEINIVEMPKLIRKQDYSLLVDENGNFKFLKHLIDKKLSWRGVEDSSVEFKFVKKVAQKWIEDFKPNSNFSLDFFVYTKNDKELIFFSEVNYRKTMGYVFNNLRKQFPMATKLIMSKSEPNKYFQSLTDLSFGPKLYLA